MQIVGYQTNMEALMPLMIEQLSEGRCVKFSPSGVSMEPMLRQGRDSVILSCVPKQLKKYDLPLYRRDNGQYIMHRIVKLGDTYTCEGDNQFVAEYGLRHDQMIAVVTAFERNGSVYSTDKLSYKLYRRLWHYTRPLRHFWKRGIGFLRRCLR